MADFTTNPFRIAGQPWLRGRGVRINGQVLQKSDSGTEAGRDISASTEEVRIRSYQSRTGTFVHDEPLTKSATGAASGYYDHHLKLGDTAYSDLIWEIVHVDETAVDGDTPTGYEETVLVTFREPILGAPGA